MGLKGNASWVKGYSHMGVLGEGVGTVWVRFIRNLLRGDNIFNGGDAGNGSGGEGDLHLLRDGDGGGEDGDAADGDNLALLRGGAAISWVIAATIAGERESGLLTLFLGVSISESGVAHQSQSDPHPISHPLRGPPKKTPPDPPLEGPPQNAQNPNQNSGCSHVKLAHNPVIVVQMKQEKCHPQPLSQSE
nr:hypothetical protein [Tanacetum cinerariifolium]